MPVEALTFGCRLNFVDTERMQAAAAESGVEDALLVNTCAVTAEAVRKARKAIRRARRAAPARPVVVAGCAAQTDPAPFAAMPEVDRVLGTAEKVSGAAYGGLRRREAGEAAAVMVGDIMAVRAERTAPPVVSIQGRVRAFLQVQTGCDHRCTFCVIPYGRGNSRSVPPERVLADARRLVENGCREIVLTGVDLTAYGLDLGGDLRLGGLVRKLLRALPDLPRLRLSSIDSVEADLHLLAAIAEEERLMPHLHLSLQSGNDLILKRMKRRHSRADAVGFCEQVRNLRPDVVFGADLIAGFPTETDAMFADSLSLLEDCDIAFLHAFPFSPRPGTPAARMPQLARDEVRERATRLHEAAAHRLRDKLAAEAGKRRLVLVEGKGIGRTETYFPVAVPAAPRGAVVPVVIALTDEETLSGQLLDEAA